MHVVGRGCGSQGCDRVLDPVLGERDHVHVALHHQHLSLGTYRLQRLRQAVQLAPLFKERGLWRVQILRLARVQHPAAQAYHLPARVNNGERDAIAEAVVALAVLVLDDESGLEQTIALVVLEGLPQILPTARGVAYAKA